MRRRNVIAAQGGEFGVFAVGMDRGVILILQESSAPRDRSNEWSEGAAPSVKLQQAGYDVLCTLKMEELAKIQQGEAGNTPNAGWKPLPQFSGAPCSTGDNIASPPRLGAVTAIVFEARAWDEWRGTCRLAVGTEVSLEFHSQRVSPYFAVRWHILVTYRLPTGWLRAGV